MNVADLLGNAARLNTNKTAIYFGEEQISYNELDKQVESLAKSLLDLGLKNQQRVAVLLPNNPQFVKCYFAITRAGGTILPLNPLLKGEEIKFILNDAEAVIFIADKAFMPLIESIRGEIPSLQSIVVSGEGIGPGSLEDLLHKETEQIEIKIKIQDDDVAACLYTSGTTGKPKGALLTHGNLTFDANAALGRVPYVSDDVHLCVLPLFHAFCQMATMICGLASGGTLVIVPQFLPKVILKEIERRRITCMCAVPSMFTGLLKALNGGENFDLSSLRLCVSGGAPLPMAVIDEYEEKYKIHIIEGNGPTETSPLSYLNPTEKTKFGSVGPPIDGVQVKIVDDNRKEVSTGEIGEITVKGPNVMKGYLNQPEATAQAIQDGWFHTGDLGKVDEDGYVYIVDRKKDMLLCGGYNVYPREVEECIRSHSGVQETAVIGVNDDLHGEVPIAFVIAKSEQTLSAKEIILFCRKYLANYKCPKKVVMVDELPMLASGKIDKKQLKEARYLGLLE